jgi:hypothetical protein
MKRPKPRRRRKPRRSRVDPHDDPTLYDPEMIAARQQWAME